MIARRFVAALLTAILVAAVGCGRGGGGASAGAAGTPTFTSTPGAPPSGLLRPSGFPTPPLARPPVRSPATPAANGVAPSPSPFPTPWTPEIPVQATIEPSCILRGGTATITIVTQPKAGVAYHAVYAGTEGGAPPPYGHGHGGDAGGYTDAQGRYTSTWVVSPTAPVGPARADVIVGWDEKWGYAGPGFAVAGPSGTC